MKAFLFLLSIVALVAFTSAAIAYGNHKNDAYPGKCMISENVILNEGEAIEHPNKRCGLVTCGKNGHVEFYSCGVTVLTPTCKFGEILYPNESYPKCCERKIIC